jgi:hypothetical protein
VEEVKCVWETNLELDNSALMTLLAQKEVKRQHRGRKYCTMRSIKFCYAVNMELLGLYTIKAGSLVRVPRARSDLLGAGKVFPSGLQARL